MSSDRLRDQRAELDPSDRASTLILRMDTISRQVCLNAGGDTCSQEEDAENILEVLRSYVQPGALGRIYRQAAKFLRRKSADRTIGRYLLIFDVLRGKAEARAIEGVALPGAFESVSRMQDAALPKNEKSLLLASVQGASGFPIVSEQTRRLSEPCGGVAKQDVLAATDFDSD